MSKLVELPLFPLHTVLFPGGVLPLKVFEQRYIDMTKACLSEDRPFGVCLVVEGDEVARPGGSPPEIAKIGTMARIRSWDMPQLGILHVATIGGSRFVIERQETQPSGLLVGKVKPLAAEAKVEIQPAQLPMVRLLELIATRIGPANFPDETAYDDASWVGYRLAELLPLPLPIKQSMLEVNDAAVRLGVLQQFLQSQGLL